MLACDALTVIEDRGKPAPATTENGKPPFLFYLETQMFSNTQALQQPSTTAGQYPSRHDGAVSPQVAWSALRSPAAAKIPHMPFQQPTSSGVTPRCQ